MKYVQEADSTDWWEYIEDKNIAINYYGGWHVVNENNVKFLEADSWHDLYKKYGYCCLSQGMFCSIWLSPEGIMYPCDSHITAAQDIADVIYDVRDSKLSDDFLISRGWVKIAANILLSYYIEQGYYRNLTQPQKIALSKWCEVYNVNKEYFNLTDIG